MWTRLRAIVSRLTFMLVRRHLDEDMRLEIDAHLQALTDRYRRQGMSPDAAHIAARRQFGNTAVLRQDIHEMNGVVWLEHTVQDLQQCRFHSYGQSRRLPLRPDTQPSSSRKHTRYRCPSAEKPLRLGVPQLADD